MKKRVLTLVLLGLLTMAGGAWAEEKQENLHQTDPGLTNLSTPYTTLEEALPPLPVKPENKNDVNALKAYIAQVDEYIKAATKYIDGAANDVNKIVSQRNQSIEAVNKVVKEYNEFFEVEDKKNK